MMRSALAFAPMLRRAKFSKSRGYTLCFPNSRPITKSPTIVFHRKNNIGGVKNYPKSCYVLGVWMSGWSRRKNSEKGFVHTSKGSFIAAVMVFGFTMTVYLRIYQGVITCSSSGPE